MGVVESYLDAIVTHDWARLADSVTEDLVRVGPFGDRYDGREGYIEFISELMPTLPGYSMDVANVTYADCGGRAFVELSETVEVDGAATVTHEVLVLEIDGDQISRIAIFIQRSGAS